MFFSFFNQYKRKPAALKKYSQVMFPCNRRKNILLPLGVLGHREMTVHHMERIR